MLKIGMCVGWFKFLIHQTYRGQKGRSSRSQYHMKIVHKNVKYMPKTLIDSGNIPVI